MSKVDPRIEKVNMSYWAYAVCCRESLSQIDYVVTVKGQDPDPLFVSAPSMEDLSTHLNSPRLCDCVPRRCQDIYLYGKWDSDASSSIQQAVEKAFLLSNPLISLNQITITITGINSQFEDNNAYVLTCNPAAVKRIYLYMYIVSSMFQIKITCHRKWLSSLCYMFS